MKESQAFLVAPMNGALAKKLSVALLAITLISCGSGENALVRAHSALDKALRLSHSCSQVAERLTSLPVPDEHDEARMKQATNGLATQTCGTRLSAVYCCGKRSEFNCVQQCKC